MDRSGALELSPRSVIDGGAIEKNVIRGFSLLSCAMLVSGALDAAEVVKPRNLTPGAEKGAAAYKIAEDLFGKLKAGKTSATTTPTSPRSPPASGWRPRPSSPTSRRAPAIVSPPARSSRSATAATAGTSPTPSPRCSPTATPSRRSFRTASTCGSGSSGRAEQSRSASTDTPPGRRPALARAEPSRSRNPCRLPRRDTVERRTMLSPAPAPSPSPFRRRW